MNRVYLLKDIHFSNNYAPVVDFETKELQLGYFNKRKVLKYANGDDIPTTCNVIKNENLIQLPISVIEIRKYNYLMMEREDRFGNKIIQYYFILSANYIEENVSNVEIELDIFQTHMWDYEIKESFIEREHQDRFTKLPNGKITPKYSITNEEVGNVKDMIETKLTRNQINSHQVAYLLLITSKPISEMIQDDSVTRELFTETQRNNGRKLDEQLRTKYKGTPTSFNCYLIPFSIGRGSGGYTEYLFVEDMYDEDGNVINDDNKTSFHLRPIIEYSNPYPDGNDWWLGNNKTYNNPLAINNIIFNMLISSEDTICIQIINDINFDRNYSYMGNIIRDGNGYRKFARYGDTSSSITTQLIEYQWNSTDIEPQQSGILNIIKIDNIDSASKSLFDLSEYVEEIKDRDNLILGSNVDIKNETKLNIYPYTYYTISNKNLELEIKIEYIKISRDRITNEINPIYSYLHQSYDVYGKHFLSYENTLSESNLITNNINTEQSVEERVGRELHLNNDAYRSYLNQNKAQIDTNIGVGVGQIAVGTLLAALGLGLTGLSAGLSNGMTLMGVGMVTGGATQIATTQAKQTDMEKTPNNAKQSGNDTNFDIINGRINYVLYKKEMREIHKINAFTYFTHYGYACSVFKIPNLKSRYYYNYIKMAECNINTTLPISYKNVLIQIYTNGTTIFHCRKDNKEPNINDYSLENVEMNLLDFRKE